MTGIYLYNATGVTITENTIMTLRAGDQGDFINGTSMSCSPGDARGIYLMAYDNNIGIDYSSPSIISHNDISYIYGGSSGTSYSSMTGQPNSAGNGMGISSWSVYVDITYLFHPLFYFE